MTTPPLLNKGGAAPEVREALTAALTVVLAAMRDAGMCGQVVTLLDAACPDAINGAEFTLPADVRELAAGAAAVLSTSKK